MSRHRASLLDIVNAAKRVLKFTKGLDKSALATNEEKQSAILYQIIVIGEATKRLSHLYGSVAIADVALTAIADIVIDHNNGADEQEVNPITGQSLSLRTVS